MPGGQKSKRRTLAKPGQARDEDKRPGVAQATPAGKGESPSSPSPVSGYGAPSSRPASTSRKSQTGQAILPGASSAEGTKTQGVKNPSSSQPLPSSERSARDPLSSTIPILVQVLVLKYKIKEPVTKAEMLSVIGREYRKQFPAILQRATECMQLIFGLDLKEVDPRHHTYIAVNKPDFSGEGTQTDDMGFLKDGLLMSLLGVIFLKGNCATEKDMWEFLNMFGIYPGTSHAIFGEPEKLITRDLVQQEYLEYRQVPDSHPQRCEFLWGPRAHAETTKMKVLEFWAKVNNKVLGDFQAQYEEALRDEEERAQAQAAAREKRPRAQAAARKERVRAQAAAREERARAQAAAREERARAQAAARKERARAQAAAREERARAQAAARKERARAQAAAREERARAQAAAREERARAQAAAREERARARTAAKAYSWLMSPSSLQR